MNFDFLQTKEYDFMKREKIGPENKIMLLTVGGSHAYGTNVDTPEHTSDIDLRGIMFNTKDEILLGQDCEQFINADTDTVLYTFMKMVKLLVSCNPNTIEILGNRPEDYAYIHPMGQKLLDNKDAFLSKMAFKTFGGYACQQLSRLENALARDRVSQTKKEEHILNSIKSAMLTMPDRYRELGDGFSLYVGDSDKANMDNEIFIDFRLDRFPLRDFTGVMQEMLSIQKNYHKVNHRNKKKDDVHLNKHAMHLVRLYLMFIDLAKYGKIKTYRDGKDHELLMSIRNGKYMAEDGTYKKEFFDMLNELKAEAKNAEEHTVLPDKPDMKRINDLVKEVNMYVIEKDF